MLTWQDVKYGSLKLKNKTNFTKNSHKKVIWICDCGKESEKSICYVTTGNTSSCGRCSEISKELLESTKFGKLKIVNSEPRLKGSKTKVPWKCDCGRVTSIAFCSVTSGHSVSCGRCNEICIDPSTKYGKLKIIDPIIISPHSHKKVLWKCDCGNIRENSIDQVWTGRSRSCGRCNILPKTYWSEAVFGSLKMAEPLDISKGSSQIVRWDCKCGGFLDSNIYSVTSGKTTKCKECYYRARSWFVQHRGYLKSLRTPIDKSKIPEGWLIPIDDIELYMKPFRALCGACGSSYLPTWNNLMRGSSLTCGCTSNQSSWANQEILDYISSIGVDCISEYKVSGLKYDLFIPSINLLIEYHGLRWHCGDRAKERDMKKYKNAINNDYNMIIIYEDEWLKSRNKIQNFLRQKTNTVCSIVNHSIQRISKDIFSSFINEYGLSYSEQSDLYYYGIYDNEDLIATISCLMCENDLHFPSITIHSNYNIDHLLQEIVSIISAKYNPVTISALSDNRLSLDSMYEKMGFKCSKHLSPDYFLVKNGKRYEKDFQLSNGNFNKLWDIGKKLWALQSSDYRM